MAQRRMFSPDIVSSEEFLSMPVSSRELYFQLGMNADDDGFIQPKLIMKLTGAVEDDLKVLLAKRFLLPFQSGVVVIKHWLIHNMIRADRYKPTRFQEEKKTLFIKENKSYTDNKLLGCQNDNQPAPQVRLGKVKLGKDKEEVKIRFAPPSLEEITQYCKDRGNQIVPQSFIDFYTSKGWMVGRNKMKNWQAAVRTWESRMPKVIKPEIYKSEQKPITKEEIENRKKVLAKIKENLKF